MQVVGVLDHYGKWFFRNNIFKIDYINSGVLLINLQLIKETRLFEKCRKMCKEKELLLPDQHALNKLAKNKLILNKLSIFLIFYKNNQNLTQIIHKKLKR